MDEEEQPEPRINRVATLLEWTTRPLRRLWTSDDPLDDYALVHMTSAAGDTLVAIALANTVFFNPPVGEAQVRVALYLLLTMAPLAVAGLVLVPLLDRAGARRAISFGAAITRAAIAVYLAPRVSTLVLFPAAFGLLVFSKIHVITKNGLTIAYAERGKGLVRSNARLGIWAVVGAMLAAGPGFIALKLEGATSVLYVAVGAYVVSAMLDLRLPHPRVPEVRTVVEKRGRVPQLTIAAVGAAALRAAQGFLLFLLAFALRRSGQPQYWFGVLAGAALIGGFSGDVLAPRMPRWLREEAVVLGALIAAGLGAVLAFEFFSLGILAVYAGLAGITTELGRLAFQSLMQRHAPESAHGRVFVRYEVVFQLAWVAGALIPAMLPVDFRGAFLILAALYLVAGVGYLTPDLVARRRDGDQP